MGLENCIHYAMKSLLKNPILEVLQEIQIIKILKQSNFVKRDVGYPPFDILLHFLYMLIMQKRQSSFIKQSESAFSKDAYYRFIKESRYSVLGRVKLVFLDKGKDLRNLFGLGKEENRIYEALIAKITLSMFAYNIVSYINCIKHEPQTL